MGPHPRGYRERGYKSAALPTELRRRPTSDNVRFHENGPQHDAETATRSPPRAALALQFPPNEAVERLSEIQRVGPRAVSELILACLGEAVSSKRGATRGTKQAVTSRTKRGVGQELRLLPRFGRANLSGSHSTGRGAWDQSRLGRELAAGSRTIAHVTGAQDGQAARGRGV